MSDAKAKGVEAVTQELMNSCYCVMLLAGWCHVFAVIAVPTTTTTITTTTTPTTTTTTTTTTITTKFLFRYACWKMKDQSSKTSLPPRPLVCFGVYSVEAQPNTPRISTPRLHPSAAPVDAAVPAKCERWCDSFQ